MSTILITGGAGFIGSAFVRQLLEETDDVVVNVDKLTYAGNLESLGAVKTNPRHHFFNIDICDQGALQACFNKHRPDAVVHLAAESHVDRSIDGPWAFIRTNLVGTFSVLQESLRYWRSLDLTCQALFRVVHVSTDEVFGSLGDVGFFDEGTPYNPSSPYSASKAGSDHLARAWHRTYGLPVVVTNCSNNYGPYQFPEKLIPLMIHKAVIGEQLPIYGRGANIRDWLFVEDHVRALRLVCARGEPGATYNIGGGCERTNLQIVREICSILDELHPTEMGSYSRLISFVADRPGHDLRYAVDTTRIRQELGWSPKVDLSLGLRRTVAWYLANERWVARVMSGEYRGERLGVELTG